MFVLTSLKAQQNSENGYTIPVKGTVKVLVVWAEIVPNSVNLLKQHECRVMERVFPSDHNDFFDPEYTGSEPSSYISKYFYQASFGQYIVLGDHLDHVVQVTDGGDVISLYMIT